MPKAKVTLGHELFTKDGLKFKADEHPHIGGNSVEITHILLVNGFLVVVVLWDGGYDDPWNEVHLQTLSPEDLSQFQAAFYEGTEVLVEWAPQGKEEDPEDDEYVPVVTVV